MKYLFYILVPLMLAGCREKSAVVEPGMVRSGWESVEILPTAESRAIQFVGANNGWIAGADGMIRQTTDGGTTWNTRQTGISSDITDLHFLEDRNGWAVGLGRQIARTTDGGTTWSIVFEEPRFGGSLQGIRFADRQNGWATGTFPIVRTTDGGVTWHYDSGVAEYDLAAVEFADRSHGWIVGRRTLPHGDGIHHSFGGVILRTLDGGTTWDTTFLPASLDALFFLDAETGWTAGADGAIYHTSDGGTTWNRQQTPTGLFLRDIHFVDTNNGWVVGGAYDHGIWRTTDGGATWKEQVVNTSGDIMALWFHDAGNGWAVGREGELLRTTRGGESW